MITSYEEAAFLLNAHEDYKILRRLVELPTLEICPSDCNIGIMLDTEATGVDPYKDDVIELGMLQFAYTTDGAILGILKSFESLREPNVPIPQAVTAITQITNEMVIDQHISTEEVEAFVKDAGLIIAHHAAFDRPMVEKIWSVFKERYWACSMSEIDWKKEGFEGRSLGNLLLQSGLFHTGHRALVDCHAAVALLARKMPSGKTGLSLLLEKAKQSNWRIEVPHAPYRANDLLKDRGYRWDSGVRLWYKNTSSEEGEVEVEWLKQEIYNGQTTHRPHIIKTTAKERFSKKT